MLWAIRIDGPVGAPYTLGWRGQPRGVAQPGSARRLGR